MFSKLVIDLVINNPNKPDDARSNVEAEEELAGEISEFVRERLVARGYVFVGGGVYVTWVSKEDMLRYTPRKKHLRTKEGWLCSTEHVSPRNLVDDEKDVTCKLCLKLLQQSA